MPDSYDLCVILDNFVYCAVVLVLSVTHLQCRVYASTASAIVSEWATEIGVQY